MRRFVSRPATGHHAAADAGSAARRAVRRQQAEHSVTARRPRWHAPEPTRLPLAGLDGRQAELDAAQRRLARFGTLSKGGCRLDQELDDDRARVRGAQGDASARPGTTAAARAAVGPPGATCRRGSRCPPMPRPVSSRIEPTYATAELRSRVTDACSSVWPSPARCWRGRTVLNLVDPVGRIHHLLPARNRGRPRGAGHRGSHHSGCRAQLIPAGVSFVSSAAQFTPRRWKPPASARSSCFA